MRCQITSIAGLRNCHETMRCWPSAMLVPRIASSVFSGSTQKNCFSQST